ncbi:MAG: hypothetical protein BWY95_01766 [Bacteroidetes bacterium ADurb.BinA104]|nr:MAG: hypothetical protein BWY95_01766 [Bacteroidetes bacterium ADurb.BinA104]
MTNQTDQDYATTCNIMIYGIISHKDGTAEPDVTLTARMENGNIVGTAATGADGAYILTVPYGYTGTVDASKTGFTFDPEKRSYTELTTNQKDQNYIAKACTGAPEAPQNLVVGSVPESAGQIDLTWDASGGASGYKIYRRLVVTVAVPSVDVKSLIEENSEYELLSTATETKYTDVSAPQGYDEFAPKCCMSSTFDCMGCINNEDNPGCYDAEHIPGALVEYQVVAFNECGDSAPSNSVSAAAYKLLSLAGVLMLNADMLLFLAVVLLMVLVSKRLKRGFTAEG